MFNLFKKPKLGAANTYPAIVHEIHNEFLTAGDRILDEAKEILAQTNTTSAGKAKRLSALGFVSVPEVVNVKNEEQKIAMSKRMADLVEYYKMNYPHNKFITESAVKQICEKYGLLFGDVSMYKGFVPESKLKAIELFSLRGKEKATHYFDVSNGGRSELPRYFVTEHDMTELGKGYFDRNHNGMAYITGTTGTGIYSNPIFTPECLEEFRGHNFVEVRRAVGGGMKICAPTKDMEVPAGKTVNGYKIVNIPDPVVLQQVNGGYLIVAAWGDEASDPQVVNETHN